MYKIGQKELDAIGEVLFSGKVFRYGVGGACANFETRYAQYLGVKHVLMTSSGTTSLAAALVSQNIGPGDEVLVPACTYIASAIAVLAAGAIPVVIDIDESLTMSPAAAEAAIRPHTKALLPVHMWGMPADMDALMAIAKRHNLKIIEDACQGVGGGYRGRKLGSIGDAGAFSFNYYKNMTCGEGGAVVTSCDEAVIRMGCMIDCCRFYWDGRQANGTPFVSSGARASEIEGAIMNCQLDRIDDMITKMRNQKKRILAETADTGLKPLKANSLDYECGTHVGFLLPSAEHAIEFQKIQSCTIAGKTGRHVYTEWDPIFAKQGAHHPTLNPYNLKENADCRRDLTKDQCAASLEILNRSIMVGTHPDRSEDDTSKLIENLRRAAKQVL